MNLFLFAVLPKLLLFPPSSKRGACVSLWGASLVCFKLPEIDWHNFKVSAFLGVSPFNHFCLNLRGCRLHLCSSRQAVTITYQIIASNASNVGRLQEDPYLPSVIGILKHPVCHQHHDPRCILFITVSLFSSQHSSENGGVNLLDDGLPDFYTKRVLPDRSAPSVQTMWPQQF